MSRAEATAASSRRRRARAPESTRRAILDAALSLFAEKGFHETTVPDIVKEADVGHGTFYEYFGNRRDVLLELTKEAGRKGAARPRVAPSSLAERIRLEIMWYLTDHVDNVEIFKIWAEAASFDTEIAADRRMRRAERLARVRKAIDQAAPAGIDPEIAASALVAMMEEFARRWFIEGEGPDLTAGEVVRAGQTLSNLWLRAIGVED
jgi:AcrR family transcriptional regulator